MFEDAIEIFLEDGDRKLEIFDERPADTECAECGRPQEPTRWPGSDQWISPPEVCEKCVTETFWQERMADRIREEWEASGLNSDRIQAELKRHDIDVPERLQKLVHMPREHELGFWAFYIWGPQGTGKTLKCARLALRYLNHWISQKCRTDTTVRYVNIKDGIKREKESWNGHGEPPGWEAIRRADLTILDDLGRERATEANAEIVDDLIESRYESRRPTIFVSNIDLHDLTPSYDSDGTLGVGHPNYDERLVGRIAEMCGVQSGRLRKLKMTEQYRIKQQGAT
ncbi:MAG: hypothetical protein U5L04_02480 [Trueperaceae bacterium]|nr:hypothetical protein [Trueperaceae bacterium]